PATVPQRTGYVTLLGRPNAGKSTLLNRFVGQHLSIVTPKAQTTWQRVTGILTVEGAQIVFLDTPGLLQARDLLQRAMLGAALEAHREADVVLLVVDASRFPDAMDKERISATLEGVLSPVHVALNKLDLAPDDAVVGWERWVTQRPWKARVHRISAEHGRGTDALLRALVADLPEGPYLYPEDEVAANPVRFFAAELVRETVFEQYGQEIPYSVFCQVEEFREAQDPVYVKVRIWVERASQKGILLGAGGRAIRELGQASRAKIEHFLGRPVYLDLWVKPLKSWRKDRARLGEMGFRVPEDAAPSRA
ncbi:MAG: GTPase Era, partial [Gemmatimonadetes bacterium]|nr:GTPase Era [Gemmatimonadota bacterium]